MICEIGSEVVKMLKRTKTILLGKTNGHVVNCYASVTITMDEWCYKTILLAAIEADALFPIGVVLMGRYCEV